MYRDRYIGIMAMESVSDLRDDVYTKLNCMVRHAKKAGASDEIIEIMRKYEDIVDSLFENCIGKIEDGI